MAEGNSQKGQEKGTAKGGGGEATRVAAETHYPRLAESLCAVAAKESQAGSQPQQHPTPVLSPERERKQQRETVIHFTSSLLISDK